MKNSSISIIVRAFNEERHLGELFSGIQQQQIDIPVQTILVDSGSTDATVAIARAHGATIVNIDPQDFSFGRSLNKGIASAEGEIIVLVSAHCKPAGDAWLSRLLRPFKDERVGLVYGRQLGDSRTKFSEHQIMAQWFPARSVQYQHIPFCNNANAAIRKMLWQEISYDEALPGLEDLDWAHKIKNKGYEVSYMAEAEVFHVHEESFQKIFRRYEREAIALKRVFPDSTFSIFDFLRLFFANTILDYGRAIFQARSLRNIWEIPVFRFTQYWGTYKGYRHKGPISEELKKRFYYPRSVNKRYLRLPLPLSQRDKDL